MGTSGMNAELADYVKKNYPDSKSDLFAVFIEKCLQMTKSSFYTAMITQHAFMFLSSYEKLRSKLLLNDFVNMAHLGARAFEEIGGEVVQTASFVMRKSNIKDYNATFVRLVNYNSQREKENAFLTRNELHTVQKENFSKIPGMPIAYWVSIQIITAFSKAYKFSDIAEAKSGLSTTDNNRFLRKWFEVALSSIGFNCKNNNDTKNCVTKFYPHNKGGGYRKWYGNIEWVVNWYNDGQEIRKAAEGASGGRVVNPEYYFRKGFSWSDICTGDISVRFCEGSFIFDSSGLMGFINEKYYIYMIGYMNSKVAMQFLDILAPSTHFNPGTINNMPVYLIDDNLTYTDALVTENIGISKTDWDSFETSWDFTAHPLIVFRRNYEEAEPLLYADDLVEEPIIVESSKVSDPIAQAFDAWERFTFEQFTTLKANEEELNRLFIEIYGLQDELTPEVEDKDVTIRKADLQRDIKSFISYTVGCMFGRYSLDKDGLAYAGGDWDASNYITYIPDKDNCIPITDEEYFEDDIVGLFVAFVKKVYGVKTLTENLDFIAKALGNKGNTSREIIRNYFIKDFYKDHVKTYQKRPIYWLYDSGKQDGFKALIYMHRYTANTTGIVRVDYLHKMQKIYLSEIDRMQDMADNSNNTREVTQAEKRKEKLIKQLKETKEYDEKIAHLALSRIEIDLDDGVKVNYEKIQTGADGKIYPILGKI